MRFPAARRRWRATRRGVSDVVATILILALTVVLFASIFAFVSRFPAPPAQNVNQFQAKVVLGTGGITGLTILLTGGPPVPTADRIYLESTRATTNWQFSQASGIPVGWGTGNATAGWVTGQYWTTTFAKAITMPANLTIYIVSSSQLLYSAVVPGGVASYPPVLTNTYTVPSTPSTGQAFQIFADVSGNSTGLTVNVSLPTALGLTGTVQAMHPDGTGVFVYNSTGATKNGTGIAFIQGINATGQTIAGSVTITVTGTGSSSGGFSVSVSLDPQPPPTYASGTTVTLAASITYTGTQANVNVSVTFGVVQQRPVAGGWPSSAFVTSSTSTAKMSGPSTITVFASASFSQWLMETYFWYLNCTTPSCTADSTASTLAVANDPVVYANATLTGVGSATGSAVVGPYAKSTVSGIGYFTTSDSSTTTTAWGARQLTFSTTLPYAQLSVWNNYSSTVYISGVVYTNNSGNSATHAYTIASASVTSASSLTINVVTDTSGGTTRWSIPTGGGTGNYYVRAFLTVSLTSGGTAIGYLYSSFEADYT